MNQEPIHARREQQEESWRARLVEEGWSFLGAVGDQHRYWRTPQNGWRTEAEAFRWLGTLLDKAEENTP